MIHLPLSIILKTENFHNFYFHQTNYPRMIIIMVVLHKFTNKSIDYNHGKKKEREKEKKIEIVLNNK